MKLHIKYDISLCCKIVLQEQCAKLELPYTINGFGEIEIKGIISDATYKELEQNLIKYGIEIIDNPKNIFTQKIKDAIVEMVYLEEVCNNVNISENLSKKLYKSYGYISKVFSEVTYTSISNFIILQKIERAKQMIIEGKHSLTEISYVLGYSSVAHLSHQFKDVIGLTPTAYQRIIEKKKLPNKTLNTTSFIN